MERVRVHKATHDDIRPGYAEPHSYVIDVSLLMVAVGFLDEDAASH